ncbi:tannase/feruloyl esterase family alpha/beta hydrolase [Citricoccus nitrophenolicus]|uniref:tannase/feruloyl esterase family alpha/beta hydrolase n=1 Tax=Citricoccus nitrophenolicus TaxID=863575 RepID=UPI0031F0005D
MRGETRPMDRRRGRTGLLAGAAALALILSGATPALAAGTTEAPVPADCADLAGFEFESTVITAAETVPAGELVNRGVPIGEHCLVTGHMNERTSEVDGERYAIGFEMRLPSEWSGQYLYQANGGMDGSVVPATGGVGGGESGLQMGMAVISSDAGHTGAQNPSFGLDPQARLDYGYQAVGTLTPMAKAMVTDHYGKGPEFSYMTGGSNGGRHTMIGASRYTEDYDGFLALAPGFNLPQAATAQLWGAQQWDSVATSEDLNTALTQGERVVLANAILEQCDGLDGLEDGMVLDGTGCQEIFSVAEHVPTCEADRDGSCLSEDQKGVVTKVFAGATTSAGEKIYSSFPYDPGIVSGGWGFWKFFAPIQLDSTAVGYVFSAPPFAPPMNALRDFVMDLDVDEANASIYAVSDQYTESAMEFMTPPDLEYQDLKASGGKMMVIHGASDGVFSMEDTATWYRELEGANGGDASDFVQFYEVPGMDHVSGGPATDQHDALAALVNWVEADEQPDSLKAWVNPDNTELPADWSKDRSRPLCAYPEVAVYVEGDPEEAASFECQGAPGEPADFTDNTDPETWFYEPVRWMQLTGLSMGYVDGSYGVRRDITRGESLAFLYRYSGEPTVEDGTTFSDIRTDHEFHDAISWAEALDITQGYADGTFKPTRDVTRGEFASFLYRTAAPEPAEGPAPVFPDVPEGNAHREAISWLAAEELVTGYSTGEFRPGQPITRAEVAKVIHGLDQRPTD